MNMFHNLLTYKDILGNTSYINNKETWLKWFLFILLNLNKITYNFLKLKSSFTRG